LNGPLRSQFLNSAALELLTSSININICTNDWKGERLIMVQDVMLGRPIMQSEAIGRRKEEHLLLTTV
jgi:hypothetical protein